VAASHCVICEKPLTLLDAKTAPVCGALSCGWTYRSIPEHQRCISCGRPLAATELATRVCAAAACRHHVVADRLLRRRQEVEQQGVELRQAGAEVAGVESPDSYRLVFVPSFDGKTGWLPRARLRAFRARLQELIRSSAEEPAPSAVEATPDTPPPSEMPDVAAALGAACTACKGFCCQKGGDHAYLTVDTVRRFWRAHPNYGPDDVLAAYLARVKTPTYRDSCIFHGATGCGLPREMRSDTCNRYFCEVLDQFRRAYTPGASERVFFAASGGRAGHAGAFVDDGDVHLVRLVARRTAPSLTTG
jgi:hypothetical protein